MKRILLILLLLPCVLRGQVITTFAGGGASTTDNIPATSASIGFAVGGDFDKIGNYYFVVPLRNKIYMVDTSGVIHLIAGTTGTGGFAGDNGPATAAKLNNPWGMAIDKWGNIFISDYYNNRIRKIDASTHTITTIAGNGTATSTGNGGLAINATLIPNGDICVDSIGNLYFKDSFVWIRKIDTSGIISIVAGNGSSGYSGDGGLAINASIGPTIGPCIDNHNNLYLDGGRVRKINLTTGIITTVAGNGNQVYGGDGMHADSAQFAAYGITVDPIGNIYISDQGNDRVYKIDTTGIFHLVAGTGIEGYGGDGGLADTSKVYNPEGVAVDRCGNLYIADEANNRIRKVSFNPDCSPIDTTTSIRKTTIQNIIKLYPNPALNELSITAGNEITAISIINTLGQKVLSQPCHATEAGIDISRLHAGLYFVLVRGKDGERWMRFVKE